MDCGFGVVKLLFLWLLRVIGRERCFGGESGVVIEGGCESCSLSTPTYS